MQGVDEGGRDGSTPMTSMRGGGNRITTHKARRIRFLSAHTWLPVRAELKAPHVTYCHPVTRTGRHLPLSYEASSWIKTPRQQLSTAWHTEHSLDWQFRHINVLRRSKPSLSSWQSLIWSKNFSSFTEPERSMLCIKETASGPYPEPTESILLPHALNI